MSEAWPHPNRRTWGEELDDNVSSWLTGFVRNDPAVKARTQKAAKPYVDAIGNATAEDWLSMLPGASIADAAMEGDDAARGNALLLAMLPFGGLFRKGKAAASVAREIPEVMAKPAAAMGKAEYDAMLDTLAGSLKEPNALVSYKNIARQFQDQENRLLAASRREPTEVLDSTEVSAIRDRVSRQPEVADKMGDAAMTARGVEGLKGMGYGASFGLLGDFAAASAGLPPGFLTPLGAAAGAAYGALRTGGKKAAAAKSGIIDEASMEALKAARAAKPRALQDVQADLADNNAVYNNLVALIDQANSVRNGLKLPADHIKQADNLTDAIASRADAVKATHSNLFAELMRRSVPERAPLAEPRANPWPQAQAIEPLQQGAPPRPRPADLPQEVAPRSLDPQSPMSLSEGASRNAASLRQSQSAASLEPSSFGGPTLGTPEVAVKFGDIDPKVLQQRQRMKQMGDPQRRAVATEVAGFVETYGINLDPDEITEALTLAAKRNGQPVSAGTVKNIVGKIDVFTRGYIKSNPAASKEQVAEAIRAFINERVVSPKGKPYKNKYANKLAIPLAAGGAAYAASSQDADAQRLEQVKHLLLPVD
jgi:hypothetical protein